MPLLQELYLVLHFRLLLLLDFSVFKVIALRGKWI
jgi:hypothetical protein